MATVAIHHPQDPTRPKVIPAERYDPDRHELWEEGVSPAAVGARPDGLPEDFPGRDPLHAAGIHTLHAVRAVPDLDEIPGIGQVTEERILAYLRDLEAPDE